MANVQDQEVVQIMDAEVQRILTSNQTAILKIFKDKLLLISLREKMFFA